MEKDCLLIHVPIILQSREQECTTFVNYNAMGLFSICNELNKNGCKTEIINLSNEKHKDWNFSICQYIKECKTKIVGLSLHWHYQTYDTLEVAKRIKESCPDTYIFLGGYTASCFPKEILTKHPCIDAIIKGEGEVPTTQLVKEILNKTFNFSEIPNLYWKKNGEIIKNNKIWIATNEELDSYNFVTLDNRKNNEDCLSLRIKMDKNINKTNNNEDDNIRSVFCCLGRGCNGNCAWCGGGHNALKHITGRTNISLRSPNVVAKEFIEITEKYDARCYICFDPIPDKQDYIIETFELIGKTHPQKVTVIFECFGLPTKHFVDSFKKNLHPESTIIISPELAQEDLRNRYKSFSFTNEQLFETLNYMEKNSIKSILYFAILPNEDVKEWRARKTLIKDIKKDFKQVLNISSQEICDFEPYAPWTMYPAQYDVKPNLTKFEDYYNHGKACREIW